MKKIKQTKKKNSAAKKLIPATSMLLVSATMLATSTYAWFTMSREVELKNIQMTATVPEDYQISLGKLSTTAGSGNGYGNNSGILVATSGKANNGNVDEPGDTDEYWSNSIDVSNYYRLGKIMPASSTDGQDVFFTPDAAGVGKTLKSGARYWTAVDNSTTKTDSTGTPASGKEYTQTYEATLHAINNETRASDTWSADAPTAYNVTNDAGYYVDIPVWIRSSNTSTTQLAVDAYVTTKSKVDDDDLYLAARAVILKSDKTASSGLLEIRPDSYTSPDSYADASKNSIVDYMPTTNATGAAVASLVSGDGGAATYGATTNYTGDLLLTNILQVPAGSNGKYGEGAKIFVRVWLEGEDPNCWNQNAGQDFSINLKFTRDRMYNSADATTASTTQSYPNKITFTADTSTLAINDTTSVTISGTALTYTWNGLAWYRTAGTFPEIPSGKCVLVSSANAGTNEAEFITWLGTNKANKTTAATATTATIGDIPTGP